MTVWIGYHWALKASAFLGWFKTLSHKAKSIISRLESVSLMLADFFFFFFKKEITILSFQGANGFGNVKHFLSPTLI